MMSSFSRPARLMNLLTWPSVSPSTVFRSWCSCTMVGSAIFWCLALFTWLHYRTDDRTDRRRRRTVGDRGLLHQAVHGLRTDIARLYSRLHAAEAARDRAELKLELIGDRSTRLTRKRKWHHHSDVISLDGSDTEPADDVDKENRPPD